MGVETTASNMALAHLGVTEFITNLNTDASKEGLTLRLFYSIALDEILSSCRWGFATRFVALSLVEKNPTTEWTYSYRYPSDCLFLRRITRDQNFSSFGEIQSYRYTTGDNDVEFDIVSDNSGQLIYTDQENAMVEYTKDINLLGNMPATFLMAFSYLLAYYISPSLSKSDGDKVATGMLAKYKMKLGEAQALNLNQNKFREDEKRSSIERARQGL